MDINKKIIVPKTHSGERLDLFVSKKLNLTRSQAQKLIERNQISINGELPKKMGSVVREGDTVVIARSVATKQTPSLQVPEIKGIATPRIVGLAMTPVIIAETPDYLVVNKPTGVLVHPTQANEKDTLVAWLLKKYPKIKKVGDPAPRGVQGKLPSSSVRPGIVHRLDKEASGLMVVAKTQPMFNVLKEQFKNRTIEKEYWALVHGKVAKDWDVLTFPIARSENFERMAARPVRTRDLPSIPSLKGGAERTLPFQGEGRVGSLNDNDGEKDAKTEFFVEKRFVNFTLLKVTLHTGRMHQIRVHMLAYNHPLVGDPLYKQIKRKSKWDEKCGRLFLHSTKLSFIDLDGERQTFESELPEELEKFLKLLK